MQARIFAKALAGDTGGADSCIEAPRSLSIRFVEAALAESHGLK